MEQSLQDKLTAAEVDWTNAKESHAVALEDLVDAKNEVEFYSERVMDAAKRIQTIKELLAATPPSVCCSVPKKEITMTLQNLKDANAEFNRVAKQFSAYGTTDTEPRWQLRNTLRMAFAGKVAVPRNANDWEIFEHLEGSEDVARQMFVTTSHLVEAVLDLPIRYRNEAKRLLGVDDE